MTYCVNSPIDRITILKTAIISVLFITAVIILFLENLPGFGFFILILSPIIFTTVYFNIPKKILVTDTEIVLRNHEFKRTIERSQTVKARKFTAKDKEGLWRKFAAEGIFGYCGIYSSNAHKTLYIYASQSQNRISIETGKKKYVVSPEDPDIIRIINQTGNTDRSNRIAAAGK